MNQLTRQQQEIILDFYFRCGQEEYIQQGRDLIASNPEAARLYAQLEVSLSVLDPIKYESCPDNLVDLTIARLKLAASAQKAAQPPRLQELLETEQTRTFAAAAAAAVTGRAEPELRTPTRTYKFHSRLGDLLATAAAILLILGILFPSAGFMRQHYYKVNCANNLRQIGQAFSTFSNDHNDRLPDSIVQAGAPWWKIGYQGPESHSNTRYPWHLVREGYVKGSVFVCRGSADAQALEYNPDKMHTLMDFPKRKNVSYSFMLFSQKNANAMQGRRKIIAGDLNPVFRQIPDSENMYAKLNEFEKILLNAQLKQMLSPSHNGRGQNVLHCDGSVEWIRVRVINGDDIYTIQGQDTYTGNETPKTPNDIFLAP